MTREEIIQEYEAAVAAHAAASAAGIKGAEKSYQLFKAGLSALRPVSREQVERMRGEWIVKHDKYNEISIAECSKCGDETMYEFFFEENDSNFCPHCGTPMTDEAMEMVMLRLEALRGETETD